MNDQEKTRDELVAEMEARIKNQNLEYMNEIATPGVVTKVTSEGEE